MRRFAFLLLALAPSPALAENPMLFDPAVITGCMAQGRDRDCIGEGMQACIDTSPGGYSTVGMSACAAAELRWWDGQLNDAYGARMGMATEIDRQPGFGGPPRPSDVAALRAMQRAWIAFRDATCGFEELQWWGGTGASGAGTECRMRMTAEQTLYLRSQMGG